MTNLTVVPTNQVVSLLKELAQKLGTTTTHLWQVLLYQAHIRAIIDICLMSGGIFICAGLWWLGVALKKKYGPDEEEVIIAVFVFASILSLLTAAMVAFMFQTVMTAFFNPSYWALQTILNYLP